MADPHIQSPMDFWDYLTVILYRSGFFLASIMLFLLPYYFDSAIKGLLVAGALLAASLHIYLKHFRLSFQFAVWIGFVLYLFHFPLIALGAVLFTLGGLCYKEYFCFRVWGLNYQPLWVAGLWFAIWLDWGFLSALLSVIAGGLTLILGIQKCRMPLHFDIGDKSKYQI